MCIKEVAVGNISFRCLKIVVGIIGFDQLD